MKIAYISTLRSSPWGGSEELWFQSAQEALSLGHQIAVFIYKWDKEPEQIKKLRISGVQIFKRVKNYPLVQRILQKIVKKTYKSTPYILSPYYELLKFNPDVVVVTDGSTYYVENDVDLSAILTNFFRNKYYIICQSNTLYHLPNSRENAIKIFENASKVFFVSEQNRQLAFHQLAFHLTRTDLIQNPLILNSFDIVAYPPTVDEINCAVVGRLCITDKGQDILISLIKEEYWKDSNIKLHLYGDGADKKYLSQLVEFYNLTDRVFIRGFEEDKRKIWNKCHCLLMCSHAEGTPLTLLEAMTMGRVCIVTKVGGNEEWIEDGINGFLVDAPSKELFTAKLKEAIGRIKDWEEISRKAHETVIHNIDYNPGKTLIEKIINQNSV